MAYRLVFAGSDAFAIPSLKALCTSEHSVVAVITQPDRPAGRGRKLTANPLKQAAIDLALPIWEPEKLKEPKWLERFKAEGIDGIIVAAYGRLIPESWLTTPKLGCINVHASLLPAWRGASPIQSAILHGDATSGVTIMAMAKEMDTGDVLAQKALEIVQDDTAQSLHGKLSVLGAHLLLNVMQSPEKHLEKACIQDHKSATYAPKITKAMANIDWSKSAIDMDRMIRAYNPWPIAWSSYQGERVRIWQAIALENHSQKPPGTLIAYEDQGLVVATGNGDLLITCLQLPGKNKIKPQSTVLNLTVGTSFNKEE